MSVDSKFNVKYLLVPVLTVLFLSMVPQLNQWFAKGGSWNGAYAVSNYDEVAYSAYVNALIDGRPRKNDPFVGLDDTKETPQKESLYSIQFIPAYAIAVPARILGISASSAFVILNFLFAVFTSIAIFFLLYVVSRNNLLASVGTLVVLLLGTAVAFVGQLQGWILGNYLTDFFPYLRRYQPGFGFPIFVVFCLFVWRMLTVAENKRANLYTVSAGIVLAILIYTYFFLWTVAFAWLMLISFLWLAFQKDSRKQTARRVATVFAFGAIALIPYVLLLSNRQRNMDDVQMLILSHAPNLFALPEILGYLEVALCALFAYKGKLEISSKRVLFVLSMSLTPFILFNQQIITGRVLQPVHYELFSANYIVLIGAVLLLGILTDRKENGTAKKKYRSLLVYLGIFAAVWGMIESVESTTRKAGYESLRDEAMPVLKYLKQQQQPPSFIEGTAQRYPTVASTNLLVADFLPTVTHYRSLWNPHTTSAGGVTVKENRELFLKFLYYAGYDENDLARAFENNLFEAKVAFFGSERALPALGSGSEPISREEYIAAIQSYAEYIKTFDSEKAKYPKLEYFIVPTQAEPNFTNIDKWYRRDEGRDFGLFKVYHLKFLN
ncbi:MAG: hypothetical protein ACK5NT_14000 [Pyrinomonadaceae bacterium]